MGKKVVIIGAVALGPKVACRLRRLDPTAEIILLDRDNLISYGGCGIPYYVGGDIIDPEEHGRIVAFEEAVAHFKQLAASRKFTSITGRNVGEPCALALYDGTQIECLIKACDDNGDWTVITLEGKLQQYPKMVVAEKPVQSPIH